MWEQLREYYDTNYLATILAPLVPKHSRNVLWQLKPRDLGSAQRMFPNLRDVEGKWGSSEEWEKLCP